MKLLSILFAVGSIALMAYAGISYGKAQGRHATISSVLHQMQADCPTADFSRSYDLIAKRLKESSESYTDFVWFGIFGLGVSIAGFVVGVSKRKESVQQSAGANLAPR